MKHTKSIISIGALLALVSCAHPVSKDYIIRPFITDHKESNELVNDDGQSNKTGKACNTNILGLFSSGDSSFEAAAKKGGISKINSADKELFAVGPFYAKVCSVVRGH